MRRTAIGCALLFLATALSACGESTSVTTAATNRSSGSSPADAAAVKQAGRARSFVEPEVDNSIPTFGADAPARARARAEDSLRRYLAARAGGAWGRACAGLAASLRSQVEGLGGGRSCSAAYAALSAGQPASSRAASLTGKLVSLRVKGRSGFALWVDRHGQKYVMPMAREDGRWRVAQIAPVPYPLGSSVPSP